MEININLLLRMKLNNKDEIDLLFGFPNPSFEERLILRGGDLIVYLVE